MAIHDTEIYLKMTAYLEKVPHTWQGDHLIPGVSSTIYEMLSQKTKKKTGEGQKQRVILVSLSPSPDHN